MIATGQVAGQDTGDTFELHIPILMPHIKHFDYAVED